MKILITHTKPHLDDIAGIWLYQRYVPGWSKVEIKFIPTTSYGGVPYGGKPVDSDPNVIHIGVCRGRYDEHKGDVGKCASLLVFEDLVRRKLLPKDKVELAALRKIVDYVLEGDLGKRIGKGDWLHAFDTVLLWVPDSDVRAKTGFIMLDALLSLSKDTVILDRDWKKKKIFRTTWGRGVGLISAVRGTVRAYNENFVLIAQVDPKKGYRSVRAHADSKVDLTDVFLKLKKIEPNAEWYLHHSKKLLICGDDVAPKSKLSKLSLDELIELVRL